MTVTARAATRRIATATAALVASVLAALAEEFDDCGICGQPSAEMFARIDNRDGREVECCETCADHADVSHLAD